MFPKNKRIENRKLLDQHLFDFPDCEICGARAIEVHHILTRGSGAPDHKYNILSICRQCHTQAHAPFTTLHKDQLFEVVSRREGVFIDEYTIYKIMRGEG